MMIQILENDKNSAVVTDGKTVVTLFKYEGLNLLNVFINHAEYGKLFSSVQEAVKGYKRASVQFLISEAGRLIA